MLKFNCFRALCKAGGSDKQGMSINDIKESLRRSAGNETKEEFNELSHPEFKDILEYPYALEWLLSANCEAALKKDSNRFKFDVRRSRAVFLNYDGRFFDVAIGRSLDGTKPKWYKYDGLSGFFVMSLQAPPENVFVVEDCASACSIARVGLGLALCGTSYDIGRLYERIRRINGAKRIWVALDKDARRTSMQLQKDLQGICSIEVKILNLSDDAKYLTLEQLQKEIRV